MGATSLEVLQAKLDGALLSGRCPLPMAGQLEQDDF